MARKAATYYVRLDTYWQGSRDRWCGPYVTREQAQAAIDVALNEPETKAVMSNRNPRDTRNAIRIYGVFSRSEAIRKGMRDERHEDSNVLGTRIPISTDDLFEMENR